MKMLEVGNGKFINLDRVTYIEAKSEKKVIIQFHNEVYAGGVNIPPSYLVLKNEEASRFLRWAQNYAERM